MISKNFEIMSKQMVRLLVKRPRAHLLSGTVPHFGPAPEVSLHLPTLPAALLVACVSTLSLSGSETAVTQSLDRLASSYHSAGKFNGTLLVVKDGKTLLEKGYGLSSFEGKLPNSPETKHWFASVSKLFTATTVMRLVDQGKLSLDSKVADLLPNYRKDTGNRITVRMLLNHTSGVPDYLHLPGLGPEGFAREVGIGPIDLAGFIRRWCSGDLAFEPGTQWRYSNSGYVLLGAIVEAVTGKPFNRVMKEQVLDPAGLKDTFDMASNPRGVVAGLTPGYETSGTRTLTHRPWNLSATYAAGSLVGTVRDLHRFSLAIDAPGFLSTSSREAMFTEGLGHWGCGWEVRSLPIGPARAPRLVSGHEGYLYWTLARVYRVPEERLFVAMVNNTGDAPLSRLFEGITDVLAGRVPGVPRPDVSRTLRQALDQGSPQDITLRFQAVKREESEVWDCSERVLNAFGYELLQEGNLEAAVATFRLAVASYPASGNAWDSLAEGLVAAGRTAEAVQACKRAIELDPNNRSAPEMLKRLEGEKPALRANS